jgi:carbon monoxide dehydrogenase subunit G
MPGAELTETIDDRNWKGKVTVKLGPVSLSFAGKVTMAELDEASHRTVMKASGMEQRGKGAAQAEITSSLEPTTDGGTLVMIVQDLKVSGQVAQLSRGMMQDVSNKLTQEFADCLQTNMAAEDEAAGTGNEAELVTAKPVKGIRLGLAAMGSAIKRFFARLFGRSKNK